MLKQPVAAPCGAEDSEPRRARRTALRTHSLSLAPPPLLGPGGRAG